MRTSQNNGVRGYICESEKNLNPANTISFAQDTAEMFYQAESYFTGNKVKILSIKNHEMNKNIAEFLIVCLRRAFSNFSWGESYDTKKLVEIKIKLPTKDGKIDFEFMEKFIAELEAERIAELEAYLSAAGLKNTILTDEEQLAIENFSSRHFEKFLLKEIFDMANTKSIVKEKIVPDSGKIPYVTASAENNGVMTYINCPAEWIDEGNCIMIGGKTLTFTFQEKDFCSNDSHNIVLYAKESAEKFFYLFYMSALRAAMQNKYSWGNSISMKKITDESFYLPTKDGKPDFDFMEKFISAVQKIVIADVVKYSEEKISAYRQAASK